ncbi:MAG: DUF427 domain-containing protein [Sporichthya sp.]|nr:DUF427 domain-containing protein [Sporichthya sp.]
MQALWNGHGVAESDRTVRVEGNHYFPDFPADSIRADYLTTSTQSSRCPWKGIRNHVAFWQGVEVRQVEPGSHR